MGLRVTFPKIIAQSETIEMSMDVDIDKIFGRIQLVETFADYRVEVVDAFADLRVKKVDASADGSGLWHLVDAFPDFRIQIVSVFGDFRIQWVDSFPGTD